MTVDGETVKPISAYRPMVMITSCRRVSTAETAMRHSKRNVM